MISTRTVGLGLGLMLAVEVVAATLAPARSACEKAGPPAPRGGELRERVLRPRTEVDLLQLEYDATGACLLEWIGDQGKADLAEAERQYQREAR